MSNALSDAIAHHRSGRLDVARRAYLTVLAIDDANVEALHMLGILHHQQGNHQQAIDCIERAVALRPNAAALHANLGEVYRATEKYQKALGSCRMAIGLMPQYPEAICNLGAALQGLKRHEEALVEFRRALEIRPDFALVHNNLGISLRELGRLDEARSCFECAIALDAALAPAYSNLGQLLLERGRAPEALPHCEAAVRLQPAIAAVHNNLGNALRVLGRYPEARAAYLEALRLNPELAAAQGQVGHTFELEDRPALAVPWRKRATELDSNNATAWEDLARLHMELDNPAEAIPCWRQVVALNPGQVTPLLGLGWALQDDSRHDEAESAYRAALRLQPNSPLVHFNLGGLREEAGQLAEAESAYRLAIELHGDYALPHGRLAMLLGGSLPESDFQNLERRLADERLDDAHRGRLLFALAHVLDARRDYSRAAECLQRAHEIDLKQAKGLKKYDASEHERFVSQLIANLDRDFLTTFAGAGSASTRPIFVFGLPRSGTTLTEQVLASHSHIHGAGELKLVRATFEVIPTLLERAEPAIDCVKSLTPPLAVELANRYLAGLEERAGGDAARVVDKMPDNYMHLGLLSAIFPNAVFIHCVRDLRDVAVSCWMTDFRSIPWCHDPDHLARRFEQYRRIMNHWKQSILAPIHEVVYEESVNDLELVARRLIAACELEWEAGCLDFHRTVRPVRTASVTQVRQPVYSRSVARWKNYEQSLGALLSRLPQ